MTHAATSWSEDFNEAEKIQGLNNIEAIYSDGIDYLDATTHSAIYRSKTWCDEHYFTKVGASTGRVCMTLDGYTAEDIINASAPVGSVAIWSGSVATIPGGWRLCDGLQGSPDLRGYFIVGAGGSLSQGGVIGSNAVTTSATVTIATHQLTTAEIPKHTHAGIVDYYLVGDYDNPLLYADDSGHWAAAVGAVDSYTDYTGGGQDHGHTGSTFTPTPDQARMPPYYALCFIFKL